MMKIDNQIFIILAASYMILVFILEALALTYFYNKIRRRYQQISLQIEELKKDSDLFKTGTPVYRVEYGFYIESDTFESIFKNIKEQRRYCKYINFLSNDDDPLIYYTEAE